SAGWASLRRPIDLDGALALATLQDVDHVPFPVHELLDGVDGEGRRDGEVTDGLFEDLGADSVHGRVELFAVEALCLVQAEEPLDDVGRTLGRDLHLQQRADAHALAGVAVATQEHVVGGHLAVAVRRLDGRAVEPDVADVVLAAGVRAAADVDQDLARALVRDVHQLHLLADGPVEAHRAGDAQLAGVRAGAGDDVRDLTDAPTPEAQLAEGLPDVVDGAFRDPAQHDL